MTILHFWWHSTQLSHDETFSGNIVSEFAGTIICNKPSDWSGPEAAFYHSFDIPNGLVSWEGINKICNVPLVSGKVNLSDKLSH